MPSPRALPSCMLMSICTNVAEGLDVTQHKVLHTNNMLSQALKAAAIDLQDMSVYIY